MSKVIPLAPSRWNVEKARVKQTEKLVIFRNETVKRYTLSKDSANKKALAIYEKVLQRVRWSIPEFPAPFRDAVVAYCEHILSIENPNTAPFNMTKIYSWFDSSNGTALEKDSMEVKGLCEKLEILICRRERNFL